MSANRYLWDRKYEILIYAFILVFMYRFMLFFAVGREAALYAAGIVGLLLAACLFIGYWGRAIYYRRLQQTLDRLDDKYQLAEALSEPSFLEGRLLYQTLSQVSKSMNDEIAKYSSLCKEYREYVETWAHEIKIPISAVGMICENSQSDIISQVQEEMSKVSMYVDQALYYARSENADKDYVIRSLSVTDMVAAAVGRASRRLKGCQATVVTENINATVLADNKWMQFILGQIIDNSIKYRSYDRSLCLRFSADGEKDRTVLSIEDNGIGIAEKDAEHIFDRGFTGDEGKRGDKSTGIGLYLCKKLCLRIGIGIEYEPAQNQGTIIRLSFPKSGRMSLFM